MKEAYKKWRKFGDKCMNVLRVYSVVLMLVMLTLAFIQVVRRYVFNAPWMWSDEIILVILAWFSYPALVFNIWTDDHFYISSLYEKFPKPIQILCDLLRHILIGIFCGYLGYFGWKLTKQFWPKPLPASGFTQGLKYIPVIFGGVVSALFCVSNIIGTFIERPEILSPEEKERRAKEFAEKSIAEATATNAEVIKEMKEGK